MKKSVIVVSGLVGALIVALALTGRLGNITGDAASASAPFSFERSMQLGILLIAALGMLVITLVNVTHSDAPEETPKKE